jgi:hypothetical protein
MFFHDNDGLERPPYLSAAYDDLERMNVRLHGGQSLSGEAGGDQGDLSLPKSDAQISEKFLGTTSEFLGTARARAVLDRLWALEKTERIADIPSSFVRG